jgi:large subunit ribosomal protein L24
MKPKYKIKKGDQVQVLSGNYKGKKGKVIFMDLKKGTALVEGINLVSRHTKPNSKNPQGCIVKKEAPVNVSNLALLDAAGNPTLVGRTLDEKTGKLVRISKKSKEVIK